ncbi:hypothetical protein KDM41_07375 [bacterium]|nr:hypothetical protein [bacterium]
MTAPDPLDLATLTLATARTLVGRVFVRRHDAGPDVELRLVAAEPGRRDPADASGADRPFSLRFTGPTEPVLTQGMHDLDHPETPFAGLFLTRIMAAGPAPVYEAVFG